MVTKFLHCEYNANSQYVVNYHEHPFKKQKSCYVMYVYKCIYGSLYFQITAPGQSLFARALMPTTKETGGGKWSESVQEIYKDWKPLLREILLNLYAELNVNRKEKEVKVCAVAMCDASLGDFARLVTFCNGDLKVQKTLTCYFTPVYSFEVAYESFKGLWTWIIYIVH